MIVAAVLAAGGSRRLGRPKQLVEYEGEPLLVRAIRTVSFLRCAVVLGAGADALVSEIARRETMTDLAPSVTLLRNMAWATGMASSIHAATRWADAEGAEALVLHLVDQPLVERAHLERLVDAYRAGARLVGSRYAEVIGAPAIFSRSVFPKLLELDGDRGAAPILRSHPDTQSIAAPAGAIDVDTPADVQRLEAAAVSKP